MNHLEAIVEIKNIINPEFIKKIIPLIKLKSKTHLKVNSGINKKIRNVKGYQLNLETPTNIFYWNYIKQEIERLYSYYKIKFPKMSSYKINQIDLLKYSAGGKYEVHTDLYTNSPRHLSIIMNLNNKLMNLDMVFSLFIKMLDKEVEFKKFLVDYQEEQKKIKEAAAKEMVKQAEEENAAKK